MHNILFNKQKTGSLKQTVFKVFFICFFINIFLTDHCFAIENSYIKGLVLKAKIAKLSQKPYWKTLLHYKPSFNGESSLIDDPAFFLAEDGKHNPENELAATLKSFFQPIKDSQEHPLCRFPARYSWLKDQLDIDETKLPAVICKEFLKTYNKAQPVAASLIFPCAYINSPASMFGHTFINIEGPYKSKLMSYAVNYAAFTNNKTNGFLFAFKGIFGFYKGFYSILPYYLKVREYTELERRDLWEYELNLNRKEVERMFLHIWELRNIYSDYYFFDENCSYNILFLLEAARPGINLTNNKLWTIPADTVKDILKKQLVKKTVYRPSEATKTNHTASFLNKSEKKFIKDIILNKIDLHKFIKKDFKSNSKAMCLDLAAREIKYKYLKKKIDRNRFRQQYLAILKARSKLKKTASFQNKIPVPVRPDLGHGSKLATTGMGLRHGDFFTEISIRPAYHNLMDPGEGYSDGSEIEFAKTTLRYYTEKSQFKLHAFDLINITSISPKTPFSSPVSWKVNTGFIQKNFGEKDYHMIYKLNSGGGFSWEKAVGLLYIMCETELEVGGRFDDSYSLGVGGSAGIIKQMGNNWKIALSGKQLFFEAGDSHKLFSTNLSQNIKINKNNSLRLDISYKREFKSDIPEVTFKWNIYW